MRVITVNGRLGKDAEIRTTAKGRPYLSLVLANSSFSRGEEKTTWYNVTCFDESIINSLGKFLTKGKAIEVTGVYEEDTVVREDGKVFTNRNILLRPLIEFISTGEKKDNNNGGVQGQQAVDPAVTPAPAQASSAPVAEAQQYTAPPVQAAPAPTPTSVPTAAPVGGNDEDDLPF